MGTAVVGPSARGRLERARRWLVERAPAEELLVVGASAEAASELLRSATLRSEGGASFGWHRATPGRLAAELARTALIELERVPVSRLGVEAVVARVVHERAREGLLGRYAAVWDKPGFATALAAVLEDLRLATVASEALGEVEPELRGLERSYASALEAAGLADRAFVFRLAAERVRRGEPAHAWIGLPVLLLDVPLWTEAEAALFEALVARSPDALATAPAGDRTTAKHLERIGLRIESLPAEEDATSLSRMQQHLFEESAPPELALGDDVILLSAPGESRECVEIARQLLACSREGIPFDRMAILLRSPEEYRPHLEEALGRARIPAHFARGAILPDPAGRAFLALLGCAREGLSARRFAEYLSLGELPDATSDGEPPPAPPEGEHFVAPDEELVPEVVAEAMARARTPEAPEPGAAHRAPRPESAPVVEGTLRAPRRWEQLIVDAAVIGGRERWERRLAGLARELEHDLPKTRSSRWLTAPLRRCPSGPVVPHRVMLGRAPWATSAPRRRKAASLLGVGVHSLLDPPVPGSSPGALTTRCASLAPRTLSDREEKGADSAPVASVRERSRRRGRACSGPLTDGARARGRSAHAAASGGHAARDPARDPCPACGHRLVAHLLPSGRASFTVERSLARTDQRALRPSPRSGAASSDASDPARVRLRDDVRR